MPKPSRKIARASTAEQRSVRLCRLLRFRALLQDLEHEYSVLLQSTSCESFQQEDTAFPFDESAVQDDVVLWERARLPPVHSPDREEKSLTLRGSGLVLPTNMPEDGNRNRFSHYAVLSSATQSTEQDPVDLISAMPQALDRNSSVVRGSMSMSRTVGDHGMSLETRDSSRSDESIDFHITTTASKFESIRFTSSRRKNVFPVWWNPDKDMIRKMLGKSFVENRGVQSTNQNKGSCVLSPMLFPRLHWDFLGFALILYEVWSTPFQMIFRSDTLELAWMAKADFAITCFFVVDIVLNFNTGVVVKRRICFQREEIFRQYIRSWFWLDLVATIPWDMIYRGASFKTLLRFMKIFRFLRTVRLIRFYNSLKALQRTETAYFQFVAKSKRVTSILGILLGLIVNLHFLCCLWLAFDSVHADTFSNAMNVFFDTYAETFFALSNGTRLHAQTTSKMFIEIAISAEHFLLMCLLSAYAIFEALVLHSDTAKSRVLREQVHRYMTRHGLPIKTQVEVLSTLQEVRSARALQKDFLTLTSSDLPQELQQKIAFELWERNLMKLGLFVRISEWDENFCRSLSLLCREEVFATDVVLFREQDLSIAAYCIVSGELKVSCPLIEEDIPSFKEGTWVGESSLINPSFRRGLRVVSLCLSSVMAVSATCFQRLLKESNLWPEFEECMHRELFHGLCGRCGSLGDHFFDSCPAQHVQWLFGFAAAKKSKCPCWPLASRVASDVDQGNIKELVDFLCHYDAVHLLPYLQELKIYSLLQLEMTDIDTLNALLAKKDPPGELSARDKKVLSAKCILKCRHAKVEGMEEKSHVIEEDRHLLFLSHYKVEAGTEAALMRSELEQILGQFLIEECNFKVPVFLDSEDLTTLSELEEHVKKSFNVVLLLTRGVLSRPWVLVELVTAVRCGVPVVPVQVVKPGVEFIFPTEKFYTDLLAGKFLDEAGKQLLSTCNVSMVLVQETLRKVFQNIAVIYSPHRQANVRHAELHELLRCCKVKDDSLHDMLSFDNNEAAATTSADPWAAKLPRSKTAPLDSPWSSEPKIKTKSIKSDSMRIEF